MERWHATLWGIYATVADESSPPIALFQSREEAEHWLDVYAEDAVMEYGCDLTVIETECAGLYRNTPEVP